MPCSYVHLGIEERRRIHRLREAKVPVAEIAVRLGRSPSTLYRELARNSFTDPELPQLDGYYALNAQALAEARRAVHRKLIWAAAAQGSCPAQAESGLVA